MTHTSTEQERKLFEAVASDDGKWPQAIERDAKGNYLLLTTANGWMWWQAARRAPTVLVPQGWTDQLEQVLCDLQVGPYPSIALAVKRIEGLLAAAPQPPEAQGSASNVTLAVRVQMPEYGIDTANHAGVRVRGYTKQQVRELLAAHGIKEQST